MTGDFMSEKEKDFSEKFKNAAVAVVNTKTTAAT
jgi:hypothetical protein